MNCLIIDKEGREVLFSQCGVWDLAEAVAVKTPIIGRPVPINHLLFGDEDALTVTTNSGIEIKLDEPKAEQMMLEDIVSGLANLCRFNGQYPYFYSVLQHSILVEQICVHNLLSEACLLHDAPEAYLGDVVTPLKQGLNGVAYKCLEARYHVAIAEKFAFNAELFAHPELKKADKLALESEQQFRAGNEAHWDHVWKVIGFEAQWNPARAYDLGMRIYKPALR